MNETHSWESPLNGRKYILCQTIELGAYKYLSDPDTVHLIWQHAGRNHIETVKWMLETGLIAGRIHECTGNKEQEDTQ